MALEVGSRLGHYQIAALISQGGTGQIYRARLATSVSCLSGLARERPFKRQTRTSIRPGNYRGHFESYTSEIAAYELDKFLDLGMIPPTVEKRIGADVGAAAM